MRKRDKIKKLWKEKIVPNKGEIAGRVIRIGGVYIISGPMAALAVNVTLNEFQESYAAIAQACLGGDKFLGFVPVPKSYVDGALCTAALLACAAALAQGLGNGPTDVACATLMRSIVDQQKRTP